MSCFNYVKWILCVEKAINCEQYGSIYFVNRDEKMIEMTYKQKFNIECIVLVPNYHIYCADGEARTALFPLSIFVLIY